MKMFSEKRMCVWRWTCILGLTLGCLLGDSSRGLAHRVNVFAWVEGDTVHVEGKYPGGREVKNGRIVVSDLGGRKLLEGQTDDRGKFSFKTPARTGLKIVLSAGMGHRAEWTIEADEFSGQETVGPDTTPTEVPRNGPAMTEVSSQGGERAKTPPPLDALEIQRLVERSLDKKLAPILKALDESRDSGPSMTQVIGGIGYIFGLIGVAAYFSSRRRQ